MKALFVAGTDTGVGKTVVAGLLAKYLSEKGYKVITQKWIQTGCKGFSPDIKTHLEIMGKAKKEIKGYLKEVCPYAFKLAASAHLAAKAENRKININKIIDSFRFLESQFDFVVVEGLGGVLVPINQKNLAIDIVSRLKLPVLLVVGNKLGAINHALLTIEALKLRKIKILGIIFNNAQDEKKAILEDNPLIIEKFSKLKAFGVLPWKNNYAELYKQFIPVGNKIWQTQHR